MDNVNVILDKLIHSQSISHSPMCKTPVNIGSGENTYNDVTLPFFKANTPKDNKNDNSANFNISNNNTDFNISHINKDIVEHHENNTVDINVYRKSTSLHNDDKSCFSSMDLHMNIKQEFDDITQNNTELTPTTPKIGEQQERDLARIDKEVNL